jgi:hypothetical protein
MALPAGFPPALFRLEDGCLMYSATAAIENWSARQDLHLRSLGSRPSMLLLHHTLSRPDGLRKSGRENCGRLHPGNSSAVRIEKWRTRRELHPQPSRRQRGALLIELRVRNGLPSRSLGESWWEALDHDSRSEHRDFGQPTCGGTGSSNTPARHFQLRLTTPDLQSGSRITSRKNGLPAVARQV